MRFLAPLILVFFLLGPAAAESVGLVTEIYGQSKVDDKPLQLLSDINTGDRVDLPKGSRLTVSYVEGGTRVAAKGPCSIEFGKDGARILVGKPSQLAITNPPRRVGHRLPSNVDIGNAGAIRRGELSLHISRKLLPGPQRVQFSALPYLSDFELTVFDANSTEEVYRSETPEEYSFLIPDGVIQAGRTYEFALASSHGFEVETPSPIAALSQDIASRVFTELQTAESVSEKVELLLICEQFNLDEIALYLIEGLLQELGREPRLETDRAVLRSLLNYTNEGL